MTPQAPAAASDPKVAALHRELARIWANRRGIGALSAVNHSTIGLRFVVTGFVFLLIGGLLAMFVRTQLAWSDNTVLDAATYNQFVTLHGTTMMFLFAVPIMEGFALYLIPKMIGARDVPFPRLTAYGYWCYLFGGLLLYSSFLTGEVPDAGWFMYVPLTGPEFTPGRSADFWLLGVTLAEISAVTAAIELIVAILHTRAPGMAIQRMPLFAWYILATSLMIVFGFPPLILGSVLLEVERAFGLPFFDVARGGDPLLWQHLFWLFGHPEVYIIFLPAAGVVSTLIPSFARRPLVAYTWVVLAVIGTAFLSFGLWVHHMFTVGIPLLSLSFFSAASMAVAIPMGVQVFAWIATLWTRRTTPAESGETASDTSRRDTLPCAEASARDGLFQHDGMLQAPMLFLLGFFFVFVLGGLTGVMVALVPFDWQAHDSHFVVAHLHYVLIGGLMFPMFAGFYYWLPQVRGRLPSAALSRMAFWLIFIGFNVAFLPMHLIGLLGLPRRVYTYSADLGVDWLNLVSTAGAFVLAVGVVAFLVDLLLAWRLGHRACMNPWGAGTLEWAVPAPTPNYNFASIPQVQGREPLWRNPQLADQAQRGEHWLGMARDNAREMLGTHPISAQPRLVIRLSGNSWWPLLAALATASIFVATLLKLYMLVPAAALVTAAAFIAWLWTTGDRHAPAQLDAGCASTLPTQNGPVDGPGRAGLGIFLLVDAALLASLVFAYFYLWLGAETWPPAGQPVPALAPALTGLAALGLGALAVHRALRANACDRGARLRGWLLAAMACGAVFIASQILVLVRGAAPDSHAYAAVGATLGAFVLLHALIALLACGFVWARSRVGLASAMRSLEVRIAVLFWYGVVAQAAIVFGVVQLFPRVA